ncbi:MAG: hypothetical protein ACRDBM_15070 [Sporomusa sp.]
MRKLIRTNEPVITPLEPRRVNVLGDECLVDIRFIESRNQSDDWFYEYEVTGEIGKVARFIERLREVEQKLE